jgi:hypothetical protein
VEAAPAATGAAASSPVPSTECGPGGGYVGRVLALRTRADWMKSHVKEVGSAMRAKGPSNKLPTGTPMPSIPPGVGGLDVAALRGHLLASQQCLEAIQAELKALTAPL